VKKRGIASKPGKSIGSRASSRCGLVGAHHWSP